MNQEFTLEDAEEKPQPRGNSNTLRDGKQRGKDTHRPNDDKHCPLWLGPWVPDTVKQNSSVQNTQRRENRVYSFPFPDTCVYLFLQGCLRPCTQGQGALSRGLTMPCLVACILLSPEHERKSAFSGCYFCSYSLLESLKHCHSAGVEETQPLLCLQMVYTYIHKSICAHIHTNTNAHVYTHIHECMQTHMRTYKLTKYRHMWIKI